MANRVNIKFVVILSAVLIVISAGVAFLAAQVVLKSPEDHVRLGDTAMAAGDYRMAASSYSKAVAGDQQNKEYLRKWISALELSVPRNEQLLNDKFFSELVPAYQQLANSDPDGIEDQIEFLNLRLEILTRGGSYQAQNFAALVQLAEPFIEHHERVRPDDTAWWPLKRYNAVVVAAAVNAATSPPLEEVEQAIADGRAALTADPNDWMAALAVYDLLEYRAAEMRRLQVPGAIDAAEEVQEFVATTIDRSAPGTNARLHAEVTRLTSRMRVMLNELQSRLPTDRAAIEMGRRVTELTEPLDALFDRVLAADEAPNNRLIERLINVERGIRPGEGLARSFEVVERALAARPEDAELYKQKAVLESITGDPAAALDTYAKIGTFPSDSISLESLVRRGLREDALYQRAELNYVLIGQAETPQERDELIARVKEIRDEFATQRRSDDPQLQLIDARIALSEDRVVEAQALLERLNQQTQFRFQEGLWLAGASAARNAQPGLARQRFRQLVELEPRSVRYRRALAEMELEVGNRAEALAQLRTALEIEPANLEVQEAVTRLEIAGGDRPAEDPIDQALLEARRLDQGTGSELGNPAAARARLERAIEEHGPEPRLVTNLARQYVLAGELEDARRVAATGLDANPEDEELLLLNEAVQTGSRAQVIEYFLNQMEGDAGQLAVAKWLTLQQLGELEAAERALDNAIEIAPDNPAVLEARMTRALREQNFEVADTVAQRAVQANADGANGATYVARVASGRGDMATAIETLASATDRFPNNASLWRLLGLMYNENSQHDRALDAYDRALEIRPDLTVVINSKIRTLLTLGRPEDALIFKRNNEQIARTDREFTDLHLRLEGQYGDKALARAQREQRAAQDPSDLANRVQLAGLYIENSEFDRAQRIVDELGTEVEDRDMLTTLRANLRAEQGDLDTARAIFAREIASSRPETRANSYLKLFRFLRDRGRLQEAIVTLQQALPWQDPVQMQVDKILGDLLMTRGDFAGANASYTRIRNAGNPSESPVWEQRRIETLIRTGQVDEASAALASLPEDQRTLSTRLLEADLVMRMGDAARARSLLDGIVNEYPDNALVYVKRAEAMSDQPELQRDRLLDLDKAIELSPGFWQAYRARSRLYASMNRAEEAINDLRKAIELNPGLDDARLNLVEYLVNQGRTNEAVEIARDAMALKPRDADLRDRLGTAFALANRQREAVQMYRSALDIELTPARAVRVLDLLLSDSPPRTVDAESVLARPGMADLIEQDGGLRLMRARVFHLQGRSDAALRESVEAYRSLRPIARDMLVWFNFIQTMLDDRTATLDFLDRFGAEPGTSEWARLFRGLLLISEDDTKAEGRRILEQHAAATADSEVAFTAWRSLGTNAYGDEQYTDAIAAWERAAEKRPNDPTVLNNMAYTYSIQLNEHAKAVPLARRAAELAPNDSDVLHTLGVSLLRAGDAETSVRALEAARATAQNPASWVAACVHLAEALLALERPEEAREITEAVQQRVADPSALNDVIRQDYERLLADLGMN